MSGTRIRIFSFSLATAFLVLVSASAPAQETWSWLGGTSDVASSANWSLSTPGGQAGPPGVTAGTQFGRIASYGATGSTTLTQGNANYWLEQFVFQPGAQAYSYTATDAAGYLSLAPASTAVDINAIDNQSTSLQIFNFPSTGTGLGYDGYIKSNAGGGDVVVNGPVLAGDGSTSGARFSGATGSGNVYFNVDTTVNPNGNVNGGSWTSATINTNAYLNTRGRFFTDGLSGRVYLGNIGTDYRGSIHLNSNQGGAVRLTHDNSLGNQGAFGGTGTGVTAVFIQGGSFEADPVTAYSTTLELANNISVRRAVMWMGPRAGATIGNTPHISNVSGNNTLTFGADWNTYGTNSRTTGFIDGNWNIESQAGMLTIAGGDAGGLIYNTAGVNVNLQLMGAGNGTIDVPINTWQTNPSLGIVKKGTGTWTLTNPNVATLGGGTFTGKVTVQQGTLALTGSGSLADASSIDVKSGGILDVTGLAGGLYTLNFANVMTKGAGTITGSLTAGFGNTIAPGDSVGTLTVSNALTLDGGGALAMELTSTPGVNDKIAVGGDLTLNGLTDVPLTLLNGSLGSGTYTLMTYGGTLTGGVGNLNVTGTPNSPRQSFATSDSTPGQINLVVTGNAANLTWVGGVNGNIWVDGLADANSINWTGATDNHFYNGDNVTFTSSGTTFTPNVSGTVNPGNMTFSNGAGANYTVSGGAIVAAGTALFSGAGNVTFSNASTNLSNMNVTGSGNVNVTTGDFTVFNSLTMNGSGTVTFSNDFGQLAAPPTIAINSGTIAVNRIDDLIGGAAIPSNFTGAGTLQKLGANTIETTGDNSGFSGTMVVTSGTLATRSTTALANTTVQSGATLDLGSTTTGAAVPGGGTKAITISGDGVSIGQGALSVTTSGPNTNGNNAHVGQLTLAANATIRAKSPSSVSTQDRAILWVDGPVVGNGNSLTAIVDTSLFGATEIDFVNNGAMNINNLNLSGGGAFYVAGTTDLGASGTITLGDVVLNGDPTDNTVGRLGIYGNTTGHGEPISVSKPITVTSIGGGIELYRQSGPYTLASNIQMNGDLDIDLYNSLSNSVNIMNISGAITGNGNLVVHLSANATASRTGTVQLVSNGNNYSGTTTIGGGGGFSGVAAANDRITLNVNGTHTGGGDYTVNTTGTLGGTGSITANVIVNAGGTLNPGASVGTFTVGSAIFNTDFVTPGRLLIEYDGAADTIDKLVVTGALNITDALLDFDNLGTGVLNGSPKIFASYGSLIGTFINPVDLPADYNIDYDYLGSKQIALVGGPAVSPGDYNNDGKVNAADYVLWRKDPASYGGDPDGYNTWRANFGNPPGAGSGAGLDGGAVPEPATIGLALLAGVATLIARRGSRRRDGALLGQ